MHASAPAFRNLFLVTAVLAAGAAAAATDAEVVAALDMQFQAAVKRNDWQTMDRILHPDYILVLGNGKVIDRAALLEIERSKRRYDAQDEVAGTQTVRMFGNDTATVTAMLYLKGDNLETGKNFDFKLWFTDTYVRTPQGWKYAFGQASLPLPAEAPKH